MTTCQLTRNISLAIAVSISALSAADENSASSSQWTPVSPQQGIYSRGALGASIKVGYLSEGSTLSGTNLLQLHAPSGLVMRFASFGNLAGASGTLISMRFRIEVVGSGLVFDGTAESLNGQVISIPTSLTSGPIGLRLTRQLTALKNVPAGQYTNQGVVTLSQM